MRGDIRVGDTVAFLINGVYQESKVFKTDGFFVMVDYLEGSRQQHNKEMPIPVGEVTLVFKAKQPEFTDAEVKSFLQR